MHPLLRATVLTISIALLPAAVIACNSSGGLSLEDYFAELEKLDANQSEKQDDIDAEYEDKLNPTDFSDEVINDYVAYFEASRDNAQDFVDELKDLDPPDEASDAHDEAVAAFDDCLNETGKLVDDIRDAGSFEELSDVFSSEDVNNACDRTTAACEDLQAIADDNDIDAKLDCGD